MRNESITRVSVRGCLRRDVLIQDMTEEARVEVVQTLPRCQPVEILSRAGSAVKLVSAVWGRRELRGSPSYLCLQTNSRAISPKLPSAAWPN